MKGNLTDHCPVCGMRVRSGQYATQYHKMYFHFCSEQCRERFEATPQLYATGKVEKRTPLLKHRRLRLARLCSPGEVNAIEAKLRDMMGVTEVIVQGMQLSITYDLLLVDQSHIEQVLNLDNGWWQRLRRGWVHNAEKNELRNLVSGSRACCNWPPSSL